MTEESHAQVQPKKTRSAAYPGFSLEPTVNEVAELRKNLGTGPYSREAIAQALGYKGISGASTVKIAAMVHFGLLLRSGDVYSQSPLVSRILIPTSEEDKKTATVEAVKTPKLYNKLIGSYSGKSLPSMLGNILFHEYKINEKVTRAVAKDFMDSLEFAGLLRNGVVTDIAVGQEDTVVEQVPIGAPAFGKQNAVQTSPISGSGSTYPVKLPSGILINFPAEMGYSFATGEFSVEIKALEKKAQTVKGNNATDVSSPEAKLGK